MLIDRRHLNTEQFRNLCLCQPDRLAVDAYIELELAIGGQIESARPALAAVAVARVVPMAGI
jgi:hypothetical protein